MTAEVSIPAFSNGDIDYTLLTGSVIRAAIRGLPVRATPAMFSLTHVFLTRSEIKTIKDLGGQKGRYRRLWRRNPCIGALDSPSKASIRKRIFSSSPGSDSGRVLRLAPRTGGHDRHLAAL